MIRQLYDVDIIMKYIESMSECFFKVNNARLSDLREFLTGMKFYTDDSRICRVLDNAADSLVFDKDEVRKLKKRDLERIKMVLRELLNDLAMLR